MKMQGGTTLQPTASCISSAIHQLRIPFRSALPEPFPKYMGSFKICFRKTEQATLPKVEKLHSHKFTQSPGVLLLASGTVRKASRYGHLLAIFTLEAKKHPFPTDCARLRHPVLGGKPVGKRQEMFKGKVMATDPSPEG